VYEDPSQIQVHYAYKQGFGASSTVYAALFHPPSAPPGPEPGLPNPPSNPTTTPTATLYPSNTISRALPLTITIPPRHTHTHITRKCAIKVSSSHPDVELLAKEIKLLSLSRHRNVLRILATFALPPDHARVAIVTPYISGGSLRGILDWRSRLSSLAEDDQKSFSLSGLVFRRTSAAAANANSNDQRRGKLSEEEAKAVVKQVTEGLAYLHDRGFLHVSTCICARQLRTRLRLSNSVISKLGTCWSMRTGLFSLLILVLEAI
jgi:serine/threonine-protein kinase OSR1/STK39